MRVCGVEITNAVKEVIIESALLVEYNLGRRLVDDEMDMLTMAIARYLARRNALTVQ